ncbi:winged helix DNA-binding domain-containing protein [Actinophytocola sp.]|uniref:winged helix DNA-binding domain-containing protein n=1 Tax=Actinophytocola sp. TaxID=1872138 RepID=UPI002D7E6A07|nr:winged helix DNA-binding domain-containing protein [Actinophytocola sp.]HET9141372.1 winged helix DNA-binding domain-containing protein [Actinophytocola sp.]
MPTKVLTDRALNRALLHRQLLLDRTALNVVDAVEHLVGMQAQAPNAPYLGLWSRLAAFTVEDLSTAITERTVVRSSLMRGTIHLVSAADCVALHPLTRIIFERSVRAAPGLPAGAALDEVLAEAAGLLADQPRSLAELRRLLAESRPDQDPEGMGRAARYLLPLVHVPPKGLWGQTGQARMTTVRAWLGRDVEPHGDRAAMLRRYLAGYGPASAKDVQTWSGLAGWRDVFAGLDLRTFRDERGAELFDLPDAALPDPDTPAPVRLLPEYDNCLRSHTDRLRVMAAESRAALFATKNDAPMPAFLVDGFVRGTWRLRQDRRTATVVIQPFAPLTKRHAAAVVGEAERLLAFVAPEGRDTHVLVE